MILQRCVRVCKQTDEHPLPLAGRWSFEMALLQVAGIFVLETACLQDIPQCFLYIVVVVSDQKNNHFAELKNQQNTAAFLKPFGPRNLTS